MLVNQSFEKESAALLFDFRLIGFAANDPDAGGINQGNGLGSNLRRVLSDGNLDEDGGRVGADLFAHNLDLFGNLRSFLLKVYLQLFHLLRREFFDRRLVDRHRPRIFEAMLAHGFAEFPHHVGSGTGGTMTPASNYHRSDAAWTAQ